MGKRCKKVIKISAILFFIAMIFLIAYINDKPIPCFIKMLTGYSCPSCGITRMSISILRGDIKRAFYYNQIILLFSPFMLIILLRYIYSYIRYGKVDFEKVEKIFILILISLLLIYGIVRNLKFYPYVL